MLSIAFLSAGDRVFTTSYAITRIWDPETGEELHTLHGHKGSVNSAGFSPDGDRIITASTDATARFWDAATGEELRVLGGHKSDVTCAAFLPAGDRIVTASADHTARIWDAATGDELACWTLDTSITALAVHGPMLVLGDRLGGVHSYSLSSHRGVWSAQ